MVHSSTKKIKTALISVFNKDGLETIVKALHQLDVTIYSTGGTQKFIEELGISCIDVEFLTNYPSILGGRVKTLHPSIFGGILGRRDNETDDSEMKEFNIPAIDLVIVDLYPFQQTVESTTDEKLIIEKIDIGGPSMLRAAAKNYKDVVVIAAKEDYTLLETILKEKKGETLLEERKNFSRKAFDIVAIYDADIAEYFNPDKSVYKVLRYGENPHQNATYFGDLGKIFVQLHGKELSYNNLVDVDAAMQLLSEFTDTTFAIIKHTNVCGISSKAMAKEAWEYALAGDPESAFGGVLACNANIDKQVAESINEIFFEVLIAPSFSDDALQILKTKKNRILLQIKQLIKRDYQHKSVLNGSLSQSFDAGNFIEWNEVGGRPSTLKEKEDMIFANLVSKHLKSNAIAIVKNKQLIGKGCGQTSRIDALRQSIEKAKQFKFNLKDAVLASDAFFPFDDCVRIAHTEGITAFIQPGGSVRDNDSINYCKENKLVMVLTGMRHFKH